MQERVTDMTRRLALAARLLVVAAAFLFSATPGELRTWAEPASACVTGAFADDRKLAAEPGVSNITATDLVATSPPPGSDGEGEGHAPAPHTYRAGIDVSATDPGYLLPHGALLATAFAPRGPPQA